MKVTKKKKKVSQKRITTQNEKKVVKVAGRNENKLTGKKNMSRKNM